MTFNPLPKQSQSHPSTYLSSQTTQSHHRASSQPTACARMSPGPFCCYDAIPSTLRYTILLLSSSRTTHNPLARSKGSAPLLTSFLAHLITNNLPISTSVPPGTSPLFFAIIQVKTQPLDDQVSNGAGKGTGNAKTALSSASSSVSVISAPSPIPTATSKYLSTESYFVPIEKTNAPTSLSPSSPLFNKGFREIPRSEAMESLRFPGTGIEIGDGEVWMEREGIERFRCLGHGVGFELRVWIRGDVER